MTAGIFKSLSYHAVYDASILDALKFATATGFAGVQVAIEAPRLSFESIGDNEAEQIAAMVQDRNLTLSLHGPDHAAPLYTTSRYLREGVFDYFRALFDFAERVGATIVTIHVGCPPSFPTAPRPGEALPHEDIAATGQALEANLRRLADLAADQLILCVENIDFAPLVRDALQPLLDRQELSLCWDLAKGRDDQELQAFMWANLQHIRQVHLHDVADGTSHQVIGAGTLDFMHTLPRLARADVLDYCIEVRPRDKALQSLRNLERLIESPAP